MVLSGATTPGQSGLGSNGNKGVLLIPQSPSITGFSPSDCLVSYRGHSLNGVTPLQRWSRLGLRNIVDNMIECYILQSEFELQSSYYVHFQTNTLRKCKNSLFPHCYGLNSNPTVLLQGWYTIKKQWKKEKAECFLWKLLSVESPLHFHYF